MHQRPSHVTPVEVYADPDNPFVRVYRDRLTLPDGSERRYNRVVENAGRAGVVVMPIHAGKVGLVTQYRYPVDAVCVELPRGFGEGGSALANAMRELREETGLAPAAADFIDLGPLHPDSGLLAGEVHAFAVVVADIAGARVQDLDEVRSCNWYSRSDLDAAIADGSLRDAFTLATVAKARARGLW